MASDDSQSAGPPKQSVTRGGHSPRERLPLPLRALSGNDRLRYALELLPWVLVLTLFVFIPLLSIFVWSVAESGPLGFKIGFTLDNFAKFFESYRGGVFIDTLGEAVLQILIALLVGFPIAYYTGIKKRHSKYTFPLLLLFAIPFLTNYILRTLSWIAWLGSDGIVNSFLGWLGIVEEPISWLLFSKFAVRVGLLASYLPFMIFPAWLAMRRIDDEILQAGADLGATPVQNIRYIVLPLSMPGLVIGSVFVFVGVLGEAVAPVILGGGNITLIATVIDNAVSSFNIPLASAMSVILLVLALAMIFIWEYVFGLRKVGEI